MLLPCQDAHRQRTVDWCDGAGGMCAAFDFTTKAVLQEAVAKREFWRLKDSAGKPPGVRSGWFWGSCGSLAVVYCRLEMACGDSFGGWLE